MIMYAGDRSRKTGKLLNLRAGAKPTKVKNIAVRNIPGTIRSRFRYCPRPTKAITRLLANEIIPNDIVLAARYSLVLRGVENNPEYRFCPLSSITMAPIMKKPSMPGSDKIIIDATGRRIPSGTSRRTIMYSTVNSKYT